MTYSYRPNYRLLFGGPLSPAVKALLIANTVVFCFQQLEQIAGSQQLTTLLGLVPSLVWLKLQLWRPITYLFLHGNFLHIIFNLLGLYFFGPDLERLWGTRRFCRYYFVTGIGAGLCTMAVSPTSMGITIGASGAIYGILLAYGYHYPNRIVYIYAIFPIKVKYMVLAMILMAFFASMSGSSDGIAHWAHLGGLAIGFLYLAGGKWVETLQRSYRRWKLDRARRKFQVYYRQTREADKDNDYPPTIH
jgi:membrane associated rhomboid family serine protease